MKFSSMFRRGFTLIELLIVIVIIGILSVGLVPKVIDAPKKARDTVRKTDLNAIKVAVESFYADKNAYPADADYGTKDKPGVLAAYLQGNKNLVDPKGADYIYKKDNLSCYILSTTMESSSGGNLKTGDTPACNSVPTAGAGNVYFILGGN